LQELQFEFDFVIGRPVKAAAVGRGIPLRRGFGQIWVPAINMTLYLAGVHDISRVGWRRLTKLGLKSSLFALPSHFKFLVLRSLFFPGDALEKMVAFCTTRVFLAPKSRDIQTAGESKRLVSCGAGCMLRTRPSMHVMTTPACRARGSNAQPCQICTILFLYRRTIS